MPVYVIIVMVRERVLRQMVVVKRNEKLNNARCHCLSVSATPNPHPPPTPTPPTSTQLNKNLSPPSASATHLLHRPRHRRRLPQGRVLAARIRQPQPAETHRGDALAGEGLLRGSWCCCIVVVGGGVGGGACRGGGDRALVSLFVVDPHAWINVNTYLDGLDLLQQCLHGWRVLVPLLVVSPTTRRC
jgi:hypothetical protein